MPTHLSSTGHRRSEAEPQRCRFKTPYRPNDVHAGLYHELLEVTTPRPRLDQHGSTDDPIALPAHRSTTRAPSPSSHKPPLLHPDTPRDRHLVCVYSTSKHHRANKAAHHSSIQVRRRCSSIIRPPVCLFSCVIMYAQSCILCLIQTCIFALDGRHWLVCDVHRAAMDGQEIGDDRLG